ncbi:TspO/MBR family protein [Novosphingobium sp. PASSN1]|uniref:TspO/MBR family protein n=1 Tax=Novosphingobium sp. PASSN1 TaxID=2015561 RepID=UPI000BD4936C|nr:TspO/MBR family protein [Novosphingobium sp. PASSN1]OYU34248.1 MAG: tryptophan-rich sensory protein [Novosphingobium sp. PASSN1]
MHDAKCENRTLQIALREFSCALSPQARLRYEDAMTATAMTPARGSIWRAGLVLVPALLLVGGLSARLSGSTETNAWFQTLTLPAAQPPGPVFGIAWSILYTLLAVSAAIVWGHRHQPGGRRALTLFAIGMLVNFTWSPTFFRLHLILPALGIIAVMLIVALATTFAYARVNRLAAWLMVPYLVWLSFALSLNARIWVLNPAADAFRLG